MEATTYRKRTNRGVTVPQAKCGCSDKSPPTEREISAFTRDYALTEKLDYAKASEHVRKYLAGGGKIPDHYRLDSRIAEVAKNAAELNAALFQGQQRMAQDRYQKVLQCQRENPRLSHDEILKQLGYASESSIPNRCTGKGE